MRFRAGMAMGLRAGVAIDLGTVNTLVWATGRGLVLDEPSAVALNRATGAVVAVGFAADALAGKDPQDIEVIHPLRDGVVADLEAVIAMLQAFMRKARVRRRLLKTRSVVCVPSGATDVERQSLVAAAATPRPRCTVLMVDEPVAAAAGAGLERSDGTGCFIVDIGGGTTEAAVVAGGYLVRVRSLRVAGNALDEAIVDTIRAELGLLVGRDAARNLKMTLGLAAGPTEQVEVVGIDARRRTPRTELVPGALVAAALEHPVAAIIQSVEDMLSDIPPNLAEDVVRGKIRLAGGGAMLPGLADRIEAIAHIPAVVVTEPLRCVVRGAAEILEHGDALTGV